MRRRRPSLCEDGLWVAMRMQKEEEREEESENDVKSKRMEDV